MPRRKRTSYEYSEDNDGYRDSRSLDDFAGDRAGTGKIRRSFSRPSLEMEARAHDIALEMPGAHPPRESLTSWQRTRKRIAKKLDSTVYNSIMLVATVLALYATDLNLLAFPKSADLPVGILIFLVFLLFVNDLVLNSLVVDQYFPRLFFWLDLGATVSLIPDIPFFVGDQDALSDLSIARAGRAARAGTRAGRLIRIFKLFKLYQMRRAERLRRQKLVEQGLNPDTSVDEDDEAQKRKDDMEPSKVGQHLSDLTVQKVIVGVMALVALIPTLNADPLDTSKEFAVFHLKETVPTTVVAGSAEATVRGLATAGDTGVAQWLRNVDYVLSSESSCFYLRINGVEFKNEFANAEDTLRRGEVETWPSSIKPFPLPTDPDVGMFDVKGNVRLSALFNILLTTFIVLLLGIGAWLFQRDANKLVIRPIERMVTFIKTLASDPLAAANLESENKKKKDDETGMVEDALRKIGQLMQIGFGDAGAAIISKNLSSGDGELDAMVPGQKIHAIFGFCDIRQFTDTTECLQESVMPFVNTVADIVHTATHENFGSPNKNIGDAFLLVWKTPAERAKLTEVADAAFRSYIRMVEEIDESEELKALTNVKVLHDRIPGYKCKMGFGMHYGWAIEGAIGSKLKIDASYLSPHVNLAARLESGTKLYGKMFLFSQDFVELLSADIQDELRRVDRVTLKGSNQPMVLYTYDIDTPNSGEHWRNYGHYKEKFETAIDKYISGDWSDAGRIFEECLTMWPDDEPAKVLLWYMSRFNFRPPPSWDGYRELTEK